MGRTYCTWNERIFCDIRKKYLLKCVNFSCLFNRVPKEVVDEYLKKNEVMRKAWEEAGYKTGND